MIKWVLVGLTDPDCFWIEHRDCGDGGGGRVASHSVAAENVEFDEKIFYFIFFRIHFQPGVAFVIIFVVCLLSFFWFG